MSSTKGKLARLVGGVLLQRARVAAAGEVAPGFQRIVLRGDVPKAAPETKLQLLLPSDDMRTYTPISSAEGIVLLGWRHADGPGARWLSDVMFGDDVHFMGPQRSRSLDPGPVILVGDETSIAVAASFEVERRGEVHAVFQAASSDAVRDASDAVGLRPMHVAPRGDTASVVDAVVAQRAATPNAVVALTGGSELVVAVRSALRARGIRELKTKTYWAPGKVGLD